MAYTKVFLGSGYVGKDGKGRLVSADDVVGKIIKVRVLYDKQHATELTTVRMKTIEGEEVVNLQNQNKNVVVYPRISVARPEMTQTNIGNNAEEMQHVVSVGKIIAEIEAQSFEENIPDERRRILENVVLVLEN